MENEAIEIIQEKVRKRHVLDPHTLANNYPDISFSTWRKTLHRMWKKDEMPGYTFDDSSGGRYTYYFVGKQKKFSFKINWKSLGNLFK